MNVASTGRCQNTSFQGISQQPNRFLRDYVDFLLHNHKWWLAPVGLVLLVVDAVDRLVP